MILAITSSSATTSSAITRIKTQATPVSCSLAWALMSLGRDDQAEREYEIIIGKGGTSLADYINAGYCYWFRGNMHKAATYFREYLKKKGASNLLCGVPQRR